MFVILTIKTKLFLRAEPWTSHRESFFHHSLVAVVSPRCDFSQRLITAFKTQAHYWKNGPWRGSLIGSTDGSESGREGGTPPPHAHTQMQMSCSGGTVEDILNRKGLVLSYLVLRIFKMICDVINDVIKSNNNIKIFSGPLLVKLFSSFINKLWRETLMFICTVWAHFCSAEGFNRSRFTGCDPSSTVSKHTHTVLWNKYTVPYVVCDCSPCSLLHGFLLHELFTHLTSFMSCRWS